MTTERLTGELDFTDHSAPYITGNGFATRCGRYFAWGSLGRNPTRDNDAVYCKTDDVPAFFYWLNRKMAAFTPFVLVTHNSDIAIGEEEHRPYLDYLDDPRVRLWFAQNPAIRHPKLRALPIGIANAQWPHGDVSALTRVRSYPLPKTALFYANYAVGTDTDGERERCRRSTCLEPAPSAPFGTYLEDMARAMFCIAPRGRGIDTHRVWEALLVGTVPVVTDSLVVREHVDFPMVVLRRWEDFDVRDFTRRRFEMLWRGFDRRKLLMDGYCQRLYGWYGVDLT